MYIDTRLAVHQDATVAIDEECGDIAASDFSNVLRNAPQADKPFDDADQLAAVDDRHRDHYRRLIDRSHVLKRAGHRLPLESGGARDVHPLQNRLIKPLRLRLGPLAGGIEDTEREQIA